MSKDGSTGARHVGQDQLADVAVRASARSDGLAPDYSVFFRREFPLVARTVYLILRDGGAAEEVAQEAFIQLLRHWKKVSSYDRPDAWVRRVAIRLAMRRASRDRRRRLLERQTQTSPSSDDTGTGVVEVALRALSAPQRAAIVLHYYEDRPVDEVAQLLDCSENTVKSHLHRGRGRLRGLLGGEDTWGSR